MERGEQGSGLPYIHLKLIASNPPQSNGSPAQPRSKILLAVPEELDQLEKDADRRDQLTGKIQKNLGSRQIEKTFD
jgi:hypothetical protein